MSRHTTKKRNNWLRIVSPDPFHLPMFIEDPDKNGDKDDEDIMSYLNYRKLEEIKKDFNRSEADGLSLEQFLKVMLNHLGAEYTDKTKLVKELIELFRQIDVNNDGTLEWEEFTNHIIEMGTNTKNFVNGIIYL